MRYIVFYILFAMLCFENVFAIEWKVFGACKNEPVFEGSMDADLVKSVGEISVDIFETNKIPYIGAPEGFNSILNTPTDINSIEIVSDTEMRVYGWCYSVNGVQPSEMPHKISFSSQSDKLIWFYAYSTNKNNEWIDYCQPAYWEKPIQFCGR